MNNTAVTHESAPPPPYSKFASTQSSCSVSTTTPTPGVSSITENKADSQSQSKSKSQSKDKDKDKSTAKKKQKKSWFSSRPAPPPKSSKPSWMDASLPEEQRWKDWHKAKDRERTRNCTTGYYTSFYRKSPVWWFSFLN